MRHWNWRQRSIGTVVWVSFLTASFATLLFFAKIDPTLLLSAIVFQPEWSSTAVYSIGFFFFWLIAAIAASLTTWLIRTERRKAAFPTADDGSS